MSLTSPWRRAGRGGVVSAAALALVLSLPGVAAAAPGDLDPAFDGDGKVVTDLGGYSGVDGMAVQPDGKIVTVGYAWTSETSGDFTVVRHNPNGSLDTTFGGGDGIASTDFDQANEEARALALLPDGKIVVAGGTTDWGGNGAWAVARFNADGSLDATFDGDGRATLEINVDAIESAMAVAVQPDGKIVLGGESFGEWPLARLTSGGAPDPTFSGDGILLTDFGGGCCQGVTDLVLQPDGRIVAGGYSTNGFTLARYTDAGALDPTFDGDGRVTTGFGSGPLGVALQPDGKIVMAGRDGSSFGLARVTPGGALDAAFDGDGRVTTSFGPADGVAYDVALQSDGRIVAAGQYGGDFALARYNTDGALDPGFHADGRVTTDFGGPDDQAHEVLVQPDGKILAGGLSGEAYSYSSHMGLARYLGGGGVVTPPGVDVSVTKTGTPATVSIGDTATYTVAVRNNSASASANGVQLTDTLTGTATILSVTTTRGTCTTAPGRVTCPVGTLTAAGTPGATAVVTITVEPSRTGTLTDTATVTATESDPSTSNNTATATTTVNNSRGCTIIGTSGNDTLNGGYYADVICGLSGNDTIRASHGNDTAYGGPGNDNIDGGFGDDTLNGGTGGDVLTGYYGNDRLTTTDGVAGNDTANGGPGTDTCTTDTGDTRIGCP
ncbi:calcium-binding protein [Streptomyces sp. NPDC086023]|uniref:calcium-binding protein n=1 Tax=Streptomyces sp. NPDC086023 TaxID=3365746 RepID=UPI0037D69B43